MAEKVKKEKEKKSRSKRSRKSYLQSVAAKGGGARPRAQYLKFGDVSEGDVHEGDVVCLFGETGYMEIAINKDKASSLLDIKVGSHIQIEFI